MRLKQTHNDIVVVIINVGILVNKDLCLGSCSLVKVSFLYHNGSF